uniref:Uncharacterized protein n=1 Tax=Arundo donax TaxID=35708 RepID=A0A0A8YTF6_ARUDO
MRMTCIGLRHYKIQSGPTASLALSWWMQPNGIKFNCPIYMPCTASAWHCHGQPSTSLFVCLTPLSFRFHYGCTHQLLPME